MKTFVGLDVFYLFCGASKHQKRVDFEQLSVCIRNYYGDDVEKVAYVVREESRKPPVLEGLLARNGFRVSPLVVPRTSGLAGSPHAVQLTLDVVDRVESTSHFVLFAGARQFADLVTRIHRSEKTVDVWGYRTSISDFLEHSADQVVYLENEKVFFSTLGGHNGR